MEKSKVYFTNMKVSEKENLLQKLNRLIKTAGIDQIDFERKYAAIKIHLGNQEIWHFYVLIMLRL